MNKRPNIPSPTVDQVNSYLDEWSKLNDYTKQEEALDLLFFELCPKNTDISSILLKVVTLNDFYSTHILNVFPVAKHIQSLKIDERLAKGDVTLVKDIRKITFKKQGEDVEKDFYSFATKYCSHHKPKDYPIYDYYVEKILIHFKEVDKKFRVEFEPEFCPGV